ncbi:MAG: hypothetical protein IKP40_03245 [Clostridia bacterium]|nr:hypothetical protein [Clostridia bacterium]
MDSLKKQLFSICTEMLDEIAGVPADAYYGTPPKVFYIDFGYGNQALQDYPIKALETYRYHDGALERVETGSVNRIKPVSGMYFPEGHAFL